MSHAKILYIDDEDINVELFEINFMGEFDVLSCSTGEEGLVMLDTHPEIAIVLSDMKMPGMNGLDFIKTAKEKHPDKNYALVTGYDIGPDIQHAIKSNLIKRYFCKPMDFDELSIALQGFTHPAANQAD